MTVHFRKKVAVLTGEMAVLFAYVIIHSSLVELTFTNDITAFGKIMNIMNYFGSNYKSTPTV